MFKKISLLISFSILGAASTILLPSCSKQEASNGGLTSISVKGVISKLQELKEKAESDSSYNVVHYTNWYQFGIYGGAEEFYNADGTSTSTISSTTTKISLCLDTQQWSFQFDSDSNWASYGYTEMHHKQFVEGYFPDGVEVDEDNFVISSSSFEGTSSLYLYYFTSSNDSALKSNLSETIKALIDGFQDVPSGVTVLTKSKLDMGVSQSDYDNFIEEFAS